MTSRDQIVEYLNQKLRIREIGDSSLNGLQVEGRSDITRIAVAVDSGRSVIERAVELKAGMLVVHHGIFWGNAIPITGHTKKTFDVIFAGGLNLHAAHLPLDSDPDWGNNFTIARLLGMDELRHGIAYHGNEIACVGNNVSKLNLDQMKSRLASLPGGAKTSEVLAFGPSIPARVCVVTGAGCDALYHAETEQFDTLVTGEPRQFAYHYAKERKLNVIFAGHYATETVGVQELAKAVEKKFGVPWNFIDEPTGI